MSSFPVVLIAFCFGVLLTVAVGYLSDRYGAFREEREDTRECLGKLFMSYNESRRVPYNWEKE